MIIRSWMNEWILCISRSYYVMQLQRLEYKIAQDKFLTDRGLIWNSRRKNSCTLYISFYMENGNNTQCLLITVWFLLTVSCNRLICFNYALLHTWHPLRIETSRRLICNNLAWLRRLMVLNVCWLIACGGVSPEYAHRSKIFWNTAAVRA